MSRIWAFDVDKHGVYSGEDYMEKFCKSSRKQAMKIINKQTARIARKDKNLLHLQKKVCT